MSKKKFVIPVILVILAAIIVTAFLTTSKTPSVIKFNLAHFFPSTHPVEKELARKWIAAVQDATGGRVQVTSYPGETLIKAAEIYDGVVSGVADIGISCFSYTRGRFPVLEVFELPGITYLNSKVSGKVAWEGIKQLAPKEVQDTHLLMVFTTGSGDLLTKSPVRNLQDLQGMEIRATGLSAKTLQTLGATPVAMPQSETYEALSRGIVQGNLSPLEVLAGWRHAEVTDYITFTPFMYTTLFFMTINLDLWNSLAPELQKSITEVNEKLFEEVAIGLWDAQNEAALKMAVEEMGIRTIELPPSETEKWISRALPVQNEFVAKMNGMGLQGEEILGIVKDLAAHYNRVYGAEENKE